LKGRERESACVCVCSDMQKSYMEKNVAKVTSFRKVGDRNDDDK